MLPINYQQLGMEFSHKYQLDHMIWSCRALTCDLKMRVFARECPKITFNTNFGNSIQFQHYCYEVPSYQYVMHDNSTKNEIHIQISGIFCFTKWKFLYVYHSANCEIWPNFQWNMTICYLSNPSTQQLLKTILIFTSYSKMRGICSWVKIPKWISIPILAKASNYNTIGMNSTGINKCLSCNSIKNQMKPNFLNFPIYKTNIW